MAFAHVVTRLKWSQLTPCLYPYVEHAKAYIQSPSAEVAI